KQKTALERTLFAALAGLALASAVACGDDGTDGKVADDDHDHDEHSHDHDAGSGAEDAGDGDADAGVVEDPLYVVHSATQNPDGTRANYFSLVPSLTEEAELNYEQAIEVPGRARLYAQRGL